MNSRRFFAAMLCTIGFMTGGAAQATDAAKPAGELQSFTQLTQQALKSYDNQVKLFKYWALARCGATLSKQAGSAALEEDWSNTAAAYLEYSTVPLEANEAAQALIEKFLKSTTRSGSTGGSYESMKCIDLFNSRELDALAAQYIKK
ncbi:T6SS amidase immunity protein Tai4 family protein [Advenella sp. FME57]|uniref:T6SS amidase immunity protein Tai4 family protein n=1 Tax=Advenella sp. FME57 TaxID=2742604 RepID=UPI001867E149|nr:T6SS amidase immunity protein Tai4 family protein [Advenella sp. FME57]